MAGISSTTHCSDEKRLSAAPIRVISFPTINWSTFTTRTGMASSANLNLAIGRMLNLIVGKSRLRILPTLTGSESASNQLISEDELIIRSNTKKQLNCAVIAESLLSICFASISSRRSQVLAPYRHYRAERRTGSQYGLFTFACEQLDKMTHNFPHYF